MRRTTMARWLLATTLLAAAAGCDAGSTGSGAAATPDAADDPRPGAHLLTMQWADREREYLVDAPGGYDPARPTPLLVVLHGRPSSAFEVRADSGLEAFAAKHGMLVVYPEGVDQSWSADSTDTYDDVGFIKAVVAHLVKVWNADPARVYASGFSAGASMSYRLAAEAADVFAAIAPVTGPFLGASETVTPAAPVSVIAVVGMDDSAWRDPTLRGLERWRAALGCPPGAAEPVADAPGVARISARCRDGSDVVEYRIDGLTHTWPPANAFGIDVNEQLWAFLTAHTRPG